jgi:hypothetical protein
VNGKELGHELGALNYVMGKMNEGIQKNATVPIVIKTLSSVVLERLEKLIKKIASEMEKNK